MKEKKREENKMIHISLYMQVKNKLINPKHDCIVSFKTRFKVIINDIGLM
jgi:hypothetical protein